MTCTDNTEGTRSITWNIAESMQSTFVHVHKISESETVHLVYL